jgi:hypothetical protein
LFTVIEYTLFATYIFLILKKPFFRNAIIILSVFFYLIASYNYLSTVGKQGFDSLSASIESILIIIYCIFFLFEQMNAPTIPLIYESHRFWIIIGFMLYLAGGLFLFIYAANFSQKEINSYWAINYGVNIFKNVLFAIAFAIKKETPNQPHLRKPYNI